MDNFLTYFTWIHWFLQINSYL